MYATSILIVYIFFFSSRRRHTRCSRDWSSDVCSSDLLGVSRSLALSKAFARGLGRSFRARRGVAGNLCRSAAPSRDGVPGGELDVCGEHERISPDSRGIHGYAANSQDGVSPTAAARCLPNPVRRDSLSTL